MAQVWGHQEEDEECRPGQACEHLPQSIQLLPSERFLWLLACSLNHSFVHSLVLGFVAAHTGTHAQRLNSYRLPVDLGPLPGG